MSFTKSTIQNIINAAEKIQNKTLLDNDLTAILKALNTCLEIRDKIIAQSNETEFYWNEIISELLAVLYSSISGYPRLGITGLRNILELVCHGFFFYDHPIELKLSVNENSKADRYVSTLIKDYDFFKSNYIKTFKPDINIIQTTEDSVSIYLKKEYATLCDVVHGRHNTLTKNESLKITYVKKDFKNFENHFLNVTSIIANLYILRFDSFENSDFSEHASRLNLLKF